VTLSQQDWLTALHQANVPDIVTPEQFEKIAEGVNLPGPVEPNPMSRFSVAAILAHRDAQQQAARRG
jgi:hypothetical protein